MHKLHDDAVLHVAERRHVIHSRCLKRLFTDRSYAPPVQPTVWELHPDTKCPTTRLRFPAAEHARYSTIDYQRRCNNPQQLSFHDLHAPARCVHLRTDAQPHHRHLVEGAQHACTRQMYKCHVVPDIVLSLNTI